MIPFQRLHPAAVLPSRAHDHDAGLDLSCVEPFTIAPGQRLSVPTGLAVAIPKGHAGLVLPRSGLALRNGISVVNAPGLIDSGYRGEIRVILLNTDPAETFSADAGTRIAQLLIVEHSIGLPTWVDSLDVTDRGQGGFGSSGLAADTAG